MIKRLLLFSLFSVSLISCKEKPNKQESTETVETTAAAQPFFKISLAQWSLSGPIRDGSMNPFDFAQKASEMDFEGIEYVSQLYTEKLQNYPDQATAMNSLVQTLKAKSEQYGVKNVLIMIDNEGELSSTDVSTRDEAVKKHQKWVDAAAQLGCHAVRVNLKGADEKEAWKEASVDGLTKLADYAAEKDIEVLVENHGGFSSNASLLMEVINKVNLDNCGTLPDFGNFCIESSEDGCAEEYPRYKGIEEMMPKAMAISAKTYAFTDSGEEKDMDYMKIMQTIKDAGYSGFIGIEYEGDQLTPEEGIAKTRELLIQTAKKLN
ncbi:sugar phosphate isomerase/epimerase family protein [Flavimarina sp. Hel_I_48]|uniref:sugar phosphate isomerase/epimerase family protein n=1 Tax=Flavimarina sp. Hel_I_48 TaxID=1392488 RepID=UPI0004DFBC92|nr:sugar phosphate isomerase/epimerase family protein [Flavimarina sp. Hel_I_48]